MTFVSKYSFTGKLFVLLLLCSVCITPVMAGNEKYIIVDGVHFIEYDDSPTILDPNYYKMTPPADFVIDGDQFYWVRIGNVVSEKLTTVWWSIWVSILMFSLFTGLMVLCWIYGIKMFFPGYYAKLVQSPSVIGKTQTFKNRVPLIMLFYVFLFVCGSFSIPYVENVITHTICDGYVDLKASDGTILLQVEKRHPETNTLYMKSGMNLSALTHRSHSGNIIPAHGVNPA